MRSANPLLIAHIAQTVGVPHQIIAIDNSENQYGICAAYNLGIAQSKYGILCFMHDDIQYHTSNWGQAVLKHFDSSQADAIGIAGTPYCSFMPGAWWDNGIIYNHILQSAGAASEALLKSNAGHNGLQQLVLADGVWFCIRKKWFDKISFDEATFPGFHFYDADIFMQLHNSGAKAYCINNVLIHHPSLGNINNQWIENAFKFQKKWQSKIPVTVLKLSLNQRCQLEYKTLNNFIWACSANKRTNREVYAMALGFLLKFKRGFLFYKTPGYALKFLYKLLFKKGQPFYLLCC